MLAGLAASLDDASVKIFVINWEHMLRQWQLLATYGLSSKAKGLAFGNEQTAATGITVAAKYFLSKRTGVYVSFNQFRNEQNAWADLSGGALSSATGGALTAAS